MRIEAYNQLQQVYNTRKVRPAAATQQSAKVTDTVQISSIGRDILTAKNAVKDAPDVRAEVVEPIRSRVQSGTYSVPTTDFADKLAESYAAATA